MRPRWTPNERGVTLIELIMVMAIGAGIAAVMLTAAQSMNIFPARSEVLKFAGSIKSAYDRSALTGLRYDVVLDLDAESYSLECTDKTSVVHRNTEETAADRAFRNRRGDDPFARTDESQGERSRRQTSDEETPASPNMQSCDDQVIRGHAFKRGVSIERVQTMRAGKDPVDEGTVRIAVFPNGTIEPAIIWLDAAGRKYTLFVHEMTGRVEVVSGEEERIRDFFEIEED